MLPSTKRSKGSFGEVADSRPGWGKHRCEGPYYTRKEGIAPRIRAHEEGSQPEEFLPEKLRRSGDLTEIMSVLDTNLLC